MRPISSDQYQQLRSAAQVIEADGHGDKVLLLADGSYLKLFRRKRLLSSALLWPYARRFADNARKLAQLGIPTLEVIALYRLREPARHLVHYRPLPGVTLRQVRRESLPCPALLFEQLGSFVARLHQQGVYFRSIHLGNIVLTPDQQLGLIDLADLKTHGRALGSALRLRNFRHMLRDAGDRQWLLGEAHGSFAQGYRRESTALSAEQIQQHLRG